MLFLFCCKAGKLLNRKKEIVFFVTQKIALLIAFIKSKANNDN